MPFIHAIFEDAYDQLMEKTTNDLLVYFEDQWFEKVPTTQ
jgi:hypothetical protein